MAWTRNSSAMSTSNSRVNYRIQITQNSQSVANNTSSVTVKVHVWRNNTGYTTYGTGTVYVTINGTSYSAGITSSHKFTYNSYTEVFSRTLNISHGSDGKKALNTSAYISHQQFSSSSQSFNTALDTIPRASTLSAFSFASHLKPSTAVTINYTVDRKSSSFRHQIKLLDGSHEVQRWDNVSSNGASTLTLSSSSVNSLLNRMKSATSRTLTLRVATRSGHNGGWVGSAVTRNANISVHSSVKPTISGLSISQTGNSVSSHTLQGISRITASFTRGAGYGASISSSTITVRRKGSNDDVQTINSNSGTTGRAVAHSGTYQARGMVRDSRGRTTYTAWTDFSVTAYSPPRITSFTATRNASTPTIVNIVRNTTHTNLGTSNPLTFTVQRRQGTGAWANVSTNPTGSYTTSPLTNGSSTSTGNSVTSSYEFRLVVTDKFNNSAESIVSVSTQRVVLDIHKNEGVGIGKIRERGVLDVDGEAYIRGVLTAQIDSKGSALRVQSDLTNGHGYVGYFGSDDKRKGYVGFGSTNSNHLIIANEHTSDAGVRFNADRVLVGWDDVVGEGTNSNGRWVRFYDGTQICYTENFSVNGYVDNNVLRSRWTFPISFRSDTGQQNGRPAIFVTKNEYTGSGVLRGSSEGAVVFDHGSSADVYVMVNGGGMVSGWAQGVRVMAIGRWK